MKFHSNPIEWTNMGRPNLPANRSLWIPETGASIKVNDKPLLAIYSPNKTSIEIAHDHITIDTILMAIRDQFGHQHVDLDSNMNFPFRMSVDGKFTQCRAQLHPVDQYMEIKDVREIP